MRKMILSQPNINYMMNMTKKFLNGKIDDIAYTLDFPYELEKRYEKMHREDDDYCELIHEYLYEEGIALYYKLLNSTLFDINIITLFNAKNKDILQSI